MQLDAKLQLVPDLDPLGLDVLQTARQGLGEVQHAGELVPFGRVVDQLQIAVRVHFVFVGQHHSRVLVGVAFGIRILRVEDEIVTLDELGGDQPDAEALEQRDQLEVDGHHRAENDGFARRADRVFDLVRPDVLHGLHWCERNMSFDIWKKDDSP